MSFFHAAMLAGASGNQGPYEIEQSLRFDGSSGYLNRTPSSVGNRKTWTFSVWLKRSTLGAQQGIFCPVLGGDGSNESQIRFLADDRLQVYDSGGDPTKTNVVATQKFRDTSAWYHIVIACDTTQSTAADRLKFYVNGSQVSAFDTTQWPDSDEILGWNGTSRHDIGRYAAGASAYFPGYMAEIHHVDGTQLDPTSFGEYDDNDVWRPINVSGLTYGTNGFYINFSNSSNLGEDQAGSNDFTASGFTTSGTGTDVMSDTPTNNFCTLNPLYYTASGIVQSEGNLKVTFPSAPPNGMRGGTLATTNAFYFEAEATAASSNQVFVGVQPPDWANNTSTYPGKGPDGWGYQASGSIRNNNSTVTTVSSWTVGDIIGVACHPSSGTIEFFKNGTSVYSGTSVANVPMTIGVAQVGGSGNSGAFVVNCGQRAFEYTPPTGFKTLSTSNLPAPTVKDGSKYFSTTLYTGVSGSQSVDAGMATDLAWIKSRSTNQSHSLTDRVRGNDLVLQSNETSAETSGDIDLTSTGVTIGNNNALRGAAGVSYVLWSWLAGGSGSTNTDGSITSTVSANATAGFSIISFTGTGSAASIGHGLGVKPGLVIGKDRDRAVEWKVYFPILGNYVELSTTAAQSSVSNAFTGATSSVLNLQGSGYGLNYSGDKSIVYCFAEVEGYSKFGSYTGNGSLDGVFNYCGFKPAWLLVKRTNTAANWHLVDSVRSPYNLVNTILLPDLSDQESTYSNGGVDLLSNGFKIRSTGQAFNNSGDSYIFAAFAENPFGGTGVSPATAR